MLFLHGDADGYSSMGSAKVWEKMRSMQLLREKGVKCELRVCDGIHNWEYWHNALRTSLPFASRNFYE